MGGERGDHFASLMIKAFHDGSASFSSRILAFDGTNYQPPLINSARRLQVDIVGGGGSGGTASVDDAAFTAGVSSGTPAMGFFSTDTVDAGDVGALAMDASRRLLVSIEVDNANIGGGTQYVEGTDQATITGTAILWEDTSNFVRAVSAAKPLPVDVISTVGGGGSGTEYTEDAAAAANPVGTALNLVRDDVLSGQTTADGDNVAARGTDKGELYVKHVDNVTVDGTVTANLSATDNAVLDTIDAVLDTINAKLVSGTVIGDVNLGAVDNAVLDVIAGDTTSLDSKITACDTGAIAGTVTANLSAVDNAVLDVIAGDTTSIDSKITACNTGAIAGTVTANLSAVDNAVLDTIDAVLDTINAKLVSGTVIGDVNLGATDNAVLDAIDAVLDLINAKLVSGTVIGDVNLGAVDNAVLDAIAASLVTLSAAVSTEMQVDIVASLPAGTNNIGDVDVLSLPVIDTLNTALGDLEATYSVGNGTDKTSAAVDCSPYRMARLSFTIDSAIVSNHFFTVEILESNDGTNYHKSMNGPLSSWVYDDAICATAISRGLTFAVCSASIKVRMFATNISGDETFIITNCDLYLRE